MQKIISHTWAETAKLYWHTASAVVAKGGDDRISLLAAGITFYGLLAIFPATAAVVSLFGLFANPTKINDQLTSLSGVVPEGAAGIIGDQVRRVTEQGGSTLGIAFATGFLFALLGANAATKALFDALNIINQTPEKRGFFRLTLQSLAFTLCGVMLIVLAAAAVVALPVALNLLALPATGVVAVLDFARWPLLLLAAALVIGALFRYGPSQGPHRRWLSAGCLFATIAWLIGSLIYSWYVANFATYNRTYGSLGAVVGFMMWMWLSTIIVLAGAEIDYQVSAFGAPRPGERRNNRLA